MSKIPFNGWDRRTKILSIIVASLIAVLLWVVFIFHGEAHEIRVITIQNPQHLNVRNFSKDYEFVNHSDSVTAIIVQDDDMIAVSSLIIPSKTIRSDDWKLVLQDSCKLYVNGILKGVIVEDKKSFEQFYNLGEKELKQLASIRLDYDNPRLRAALSRLSLLNNQLIIDLGEEELIDLQREVVTNFSSTLLLVNYDAQTLDILSRKEKGPEELWIMFDSVVPRKPLPRFRSIKEISIFSYETSLPSNLLENNHSIKEVFLLTGNDTFDLPESRLRNVSLMDSGNIRLRKYQLRKLDYFSGMIDDKRIVEISKMKRLQWLHGNVENLDQLQFEGLIKSVPQVKVLDLNLENNHLSLRSIADLKKLKGLIITYSDSLDATSLTRLNNLQYLSLYVDDDKKNEVYEQVKKSLPGTIVVRHDGPCMGSGYLLLIPVICLGIYFFKRINPIG